jgi:hypothetical protein
MPIVLLCLTLEAGVTKTVSLPLAALILLLDLPEPRRCLRIGGPAHCAPSNPIRSASGVPLHTS